MLQIFVFRSASFSLKSSRVKYHRKYDKFFYITYRYHLCLVLRLLFIIPFYAPTIRFKRNKTTSTNIYTYHNESKEQKPNY